MNGGSPQAIAVDPVGVGLGEHTPTVAYDRFGQPR